MFQHLEDKQDEEEKALMARGDSLEADNEKLREELQRLQDEEEKAVIASGDNLEAANEKLWEELQRLQDEEEKAVMASGDSLEAANKKLLQELEFLKLEFRKLQARQWCLTFDGRVSTFQAGVAEHAFKQGGPDVYSGQGCVFTPQI